MMCQRRFISCHQCPVPAGDVGGGGDRACGGGGLVLYGDFCTFLCFAVDPKPLYKIKSIEYKPKN